MLVTDFDLLIFWLDMKVFQVQVYEGFSSVGSPISIIFSEYNLNQLIVFLDVASNVGSHKDTRNCFYVLVGRVRTLIALARRLVASNEKSH